MGGHNSKKKKEWKDGPADFYTGLPLDFELDRESNSVGKKPRHGKKKTEIAREQKSHERWLESGEPAPGHEESNDSRLKFKGSKKKK